MKKILILTAIFLLLWSYNSFAGMNCTTKYHKIRARVSGQEITHEQKVELYGRLFDAERLCNEGKTKEEKKALEDAAGLVDLDEVFKDTGEKN
jgi:hypothetical protein